MRSLLKRVVRLERRSGARGDPELPAQPFDAKTFLRQVDARSRLLHEPFETTLSRMVGSVARPDLTSLLALEVERILGIQQPNLFVCDLLWHVIHESNGLTLDLWREAEQLYRERYGHEPEPSLELRTRAGD